MKPQNKTLKIEGIEFHVLWDEFDRGYSFFIPCLDRKRAEVVMKRVAASLLLEVVTQHRIEEGIRGVRMWRL